MNGFRRGQEPKDAMGLGASGLVKKWMDDNNTARAIHFTKHNGNVIVIDVEGSVVLEDFDIENVDGIKGKHKVEFGEVTGSLTILSHLTPEEIYKRIRDFYKMVLDNCIGKTFEEQQEFLASIDEDAKYPHLPYPLKPGAIEKMEDYVRNLPESPTNEQIKELVKQVKQGCLEFLSHIKNERSVKTKQYADNLQKRILHW